MWNRIWAVLSDFFVHVGCHKNLQVAMYAVDSLRQLAMKFLERDELANYSFQTAFLTPLVVVMRQSKAVEIRELIIRWRPSFPLELKQMQAPEKFYLICRGLYKQHPELCRLVGSFSPFIIDSWLSLPAAIAALPACTAHVPLSCIPHGNSVSKSAHALQAAVTGLHPASVLRPMTATRICKTAAA